jgi:orotidine-5'-phosphate decarboxylase
VSHKKTNPADRLIVALDHTDIQSAKMLMDRLSGGIQLYKIGSALFTRYGPSAIEAVHQRGGRVFLDLKFHDIPQTVGLASKQAAEMGVFMFNVHASAGTSVLHAAAEAISGLAKPPILIAVTVLTSLDGDDLSTIGFSETSEKLVIRLAKLTQDSGLDGVVASPREVKSIRKNCGGDFCIVTPGVRPTGFEHSAFTDQKRIATPKDALAEGSDYLVVGRPKRSGGSGR